MALIECKECGNQISDTAASCPKCGASVPKTIGPDEEQCPHCMTVVNQSATTCPNCRAVKGYMYDSRYGVMGKFGVTLWSVILPIALTIGFFPTKASWIAILTFLWALYGIFRLVTGPRWFQSKHAQ